MVVRYKEFGTETGTNLHQIVYEPSVFTVGCNCNNTMGLVTFFYDMQSNYTSMMKRLEILELELIVLSMYKLGDQ